MYEYSGFGYQKSKVWISQMWEIIGIIKWDSSGRMVKISDILGIIILIK